MGDERKRLVTHVRNQVRDKDCWERAEGFVLAEALRRRLQALRVDVTPDLAFAFMAAAIVLAEESPEWGGDYRDALGVLAILGFDLLGEGAE